MKRSAILSIFALIAGSMLALLMAERVVRAIEVDISAHVSSALSAGGYGWAEFTVDGSVVSLSGQVPDLASLESASELILAAAPWVVLQNDTKLALEPPAVERAPGRVEILRGIADATLIGHVADESVSDAFVAALRKVTSGVIVTDLLRMGARKGEGLSEVALPVAQISGGLLHGQVTVALGEVSVAGIVENTEAMDIVSYGVDVLRDKGWDVALTLTDHVVPSGGLVLVFERGAAGRGLIECVAPDDVSAKAIRARAIDISGETGSMCTVSEDASHESRTLKEWPKAALAALDAVASVEAAEVTLQDKEARLAVSPPTRAKAFDAARTAFEAALPEGYRLFVLGAPSGGSLEQPAVSGQGNDAAPSEMKESFAVFSMAFDGVTLSLGGSTPDVVFSNAVEAYARATIKGVKVENKMQIKAGAPSIGWRPAAFSALAGLTLLNAGRVEVGADWVTLVGEAEQPDAAADVHRFMMQHLGGDRRVETRVAISPARLAAKQPLPPARCAKEMMEIVGDKPIRFAPGSSEIDADSDATLHLLVDALSDCAGGGIEIAGYTDANGPAEVNMALSLARAEAVRSALIVRGARVRMLSAAGYGEAAPIADNATEAGRARNRRIEFRAVEENE